MPGAFKLRAPYPAAGDQPAAIESLVADVQAGVPRTVLKGATGTGKTFVLAHLIERTNRPPAPHSGSPPPPLPDHDAGLC